MSTTIEQLELEVQSSATSAVGGIDALASSLGKLKTAVKGGVGLTAVAKQLTTLNTALNGISAGNADNLNKLAQGLQTLSSCGNLKLSSSVATQITNIGNAVKSLSGTNFSALNSLANALTPLTSIGKANLNSFISQLQRLPQAVQALSTVDMGGLSGQISQLVSALAPLTQMGKNNLTSFITQLRKIPQVMTELRAVNMGELTTQIQQLANAFAPLASQMQSIANGFAAFPARIQRLIQSTNSLSSANNRAANSYTNLAAKIGLAVVAIRRIATVIASWITESNKYIENLNLFTVSMGEYADKAQEYAERVGEVMGIDPGEWMRNQGIFMTLATGFGVVSDRAYTIIDIAAISAIQMLALVEFATNNAQAVIGRGYCDSNSASLKSGSCDSVPNLTGRPSGTDGKTGVVYRGIEDFWGNIWEWVDGVNFNGGKYYVCNDISKYADDTATNYEELSFTGATNWSQSYITQEGLDTGDNPHVMLPSAAGSGSETTYQCDACWSSTGWRVFGHGGGWGAGSDCGLFTAALDSDSSGTRTYFGSRLLYIPS